MWFSLFSASISLHCLRAFSRKSCCSASTVNNSPRCDRRKACNSSSSSSFLFASDPAVAAKACIVKQHWPTTSWNLLASCLESSHGMFATLFAQTIASSNCASCACLSSFSTRIASRRHARDSSRADFVSGLAAVPSISVVLFRHAASAFSATLLTSSGGRTGDAIGFFFEAHCPREGASAGVSVRPRLLLSELAMCSSCRC